MDSRNDRADKIALLTAPRKLHKSPLEKLYAAAVERFTSRRTGQTVFAIAIEVCGLLMTNFLLNIQDIRDQIVSDLSQDKN